MTDFRKILKHKWLKWMGLAVLLLVAAGFALSLFFFQPWLRKKLQSEVKEQSGGLYALHLGDLSASLVAGTLIIDSLALVPDTAAWQQQKTAGKPDLTSSLTTLQARRLKLTGVNYLGMALKKPMDLGSIILLEPVLHIDQMQEDTTASEPLHKSLKGPMAGLKVKKIRVEDGAFSYKKDHRHQYNTAEASGLNLEVRNLQVDSAAYQAEDRVFYARRFTVSAGKTNTLMPGEANRLYTGTISASSESRQVLVKKFELSPIYKPAELARFKGEASTWLVLKCPELTFKGVDFGELARNGNVAINEIAVQRPRIKAFKDKRNFAARSDRPLPHDLVQQFKAGLHIGKVTISKLQVRYDELAEKAKTTGHIGIASLNATITNISNHQDRMTASNPAVADVNLSLVGKGNMAFTIRMPLLDPNCSHTIAGKITDTDLTVFNSILEPAYFVGFKGGNIHNGTFNLNLNCKTASGNMKVKYTGLEIDLLSKDEERKQSLPKKVLSKIANKAVVKEENLPEDDGLRTADIQVTRQQKRSVFTYWKDCLEQGMLISAGLEKFAPKN